MRVKLQKIRLFLQGCLLIIGGSILLSLNARLASYAEAAASGAPLSTAVAPISKPGVTTGTPVRIEVPSLGINLPVIVGAYNYITREWTLTNDKAQYANLTPLPNDTEGNTLIYGHATKEVFKNLPKLQPGAEALVYTDNNHVFSYRFSSLQTVDPENSNVVLEYEGAPVLTLQTCSGLWWQNRQLFMFELVKVS